MLLFPVMMMMMMMMTTMMSCLGTVVYCLDADKKDVLAQINLLDSLPTEAVSLGHCNPDKLKGLSRLLHQLHVL